MTERILVTGAAGYFGAAVLTQLQLVGATVTGTSRLGTDGTIACDLADAASVQRLMNEVQPTHIFHAAARVAGSSDIKGALQRDNVRATRNLAGAAAAASCLRFVFCSSISVYPAQPANGVAHHEEDLPAPRDDYGQSKLDCEDELETVSGSLSVVILRLAGIHGWPRRAGLVGSLISSALARDPIVVEPANRRMSPVFLDDAVAAAGLALSADLPRPRVRLNIGGEALSLREMAIGILAMAATKPALLATDRHDATNDVLDITAARNILGYSPQPFGLGAAHQWRRFGGGAPN